MANPAIAGPTTRAPLKIEEFSAIAFIRSSFPTISFKKACRMGMSNALTMPARNAITMMCHTCITPVNFKAAKRNASTIADVCAAITPLCLL